MFSCFRALATCRKCEIKFKSKFESKVPSSICRSHYVRQLSSTDDGGLRVAVSMRGGPHPTRVGCFSLKSLINPL